MTTKIITRFILLHRRKLLLLFALTTFLPQIAISQDFGAIYIQRSVNSRTQQIIKVDPRNANYDTIATITGLNGGTSGMTIDESEKLCFFTGWDFNSSLQMLYTIDLISGELVNSKITEGQFSNGDLIFNPNDGKLYCQRGVSSHKQHILKIDPIDASYDTVAIINGLNGGTSAITLDIENNLCFFTGWDSSSTEHLLYTVNISNGKLLTKSKTEGQYNNGDPVFNPINKMLYCQRAVNSNVQQIIRIDPKTAQYDTLTAITGLNGGTSSLTIDPENSLCYFTGWDSATSKHMLYVTNMENQSLIGKLETQGQYNNGDPIFSSINLTTITEIGMKTSNLTAFPNPTTGKIRIKINSQDKNDVLRIIDPMGKVLLKGNIMSKESENLNISNWPNGIYLIQILNSNRIIDSCKILKNE